VSHREGLISYLCAVRLAGFSPKGHLELFAWECVVGLRGLELRSNHVVAIEPISGP